MLFSIKVNTSKTLSSFFNWFNSISTKDLFRVRPINFDMLESWYFNDTTGDLQHKSGKFFTVKGMEVKTNFANVTNWNQPIIHQPEEGILGIISKLVNGKRHLLMQAKMEPGNINLVQLSPTVQATKSNYTKVHDGKFPKYLEFFLNPKENGAKVLFDILQPEQGARFYKKQNRNILLEIDGNIKVDSDFFWISLENLKSLIHEDNLINMDARTVLSCMHSGKAPVDKIIHWVNELKKKYWLESKLISLNNVEKWNRNEREIFHKDKKYFSVIAVEVEAKNREVVRWTQPLFKDAGIGLIGFIEHEGKYLVQAKIEAGNRNLFDLAPTVSFSDYKNRLKTEGMSPLMEYFLNAPKSKIDFDTLLSEEGGRFYHAQNRYMIVKANPAYVPANFYWMSKDELFTLVKKSYFNVEARSLIATL